MELSVIVPVYNMAAEGNLNYCIDSLLGQTLKDMEIVAVDDASTDDSLKILRDYESRNPGRVRVIESPVNGRQGAAKNLGLKAAQGRFIGFIDADDWVLPDMFEKMIDLAHRTGADAVGTDMCRVSEHTMIPTEREQCNFPDQTGVLDHETRKRLMLHMGPLVTKIYDRDIFFCREFHFPEKMSYEDNATGVDICMRIKHFEYLPGAHMFYYQHSSSTTHHISQKKCDDRLEAMRFMYEQAKTNGALDEYRDVIEYHYGKMFYQTTLFSYMQSDLKKDPKYIDSMRSEVLELFPNFRNNEYFKRSVNDYEMNLVDLSIKNTYLFLLIYALKQLSKKIRKKKR